MNIKYFHSRNELISRYVDYYYLFNPDTEDLNEYFTAYPHINTPVFFYNNINIEHVNSNLFYSSSDQLEFRIGVIGKSLKPIICKCVGRISALAIVFKPLGLKPFISESFNLIAKDLFQPMVVWEKYKNVLEPILEEKNENEIVERLDNFLLSIYKPVTETIVSQAIALMLEDPSRPLAVIENMLQVNRKMLFRLFVLDTAMAPTSFKRVIRFRKALEHKKGNFKSLTEIAYHNYFYDQAHFIKEAKSLGGGTPKKLLNEAEYVSGSPFLMSISK